MGANEILQPLFIGWLLGVIAHLVKASVPLRAERLVIKNGGSEEEATLASRKEEERLYQLSKGFAVSGGWFTLPMILAIKGGYPDIAVTLSWILAVSLFSLGVLQANTLHSAKELNLMGVGLALILVSMAMFVSLVWIAVITFMVVF